MKIRNHEILEEISRGAITTVYKARHLNLDRDVVLKVLNKQWLGEHDLMERFRREARISAHLQHPNIVNVYDFDISDEQVFISLEFVNGYSLHSYLKNNYPLPFDKVLNFFCDILNALKYAHKKGVIHRDIKPSNIMIQNEQVARLTDFGLATLQENSVVTQHGQSIGTPAYMAPEVLQGEAASVKSDLYCLAVSVYEVLAGSLPFIKENPSATIQSVLNDNLPEIEKVIPNLPLWFSALIKKMLNKDPSNRPENAQAVLDIIKANTEIKSAELKKNPGSKKFKIIIPLAAVLVPLIFFYLDKPVNPEEKSDSETVSSKIDSAVIADEKYKILPVENKPENTKENHAITIENPKAHVIEKKEEEIAKPGENKPGNLFVVCLPWAKVIIDGDTVDTTPMKRSVSLQAGKHTLELVNPNYKTEKFDLEIRENISDTVNVQLQPSFGYLYVNAVPWAKLFINDQYKDDTPMQKPLVVKVGRNIIKLTNPMYKTITDTVFVEAGKTVEKKFTFK